MRARFTQEGNIRKVGVLLSTFPTTGHVAQTFAQHRYDVLLTRPSRPRLHWNRFLRSMAFSPFSVEPTFARYARYPRQSRREANSVVGLSL
jgi:hypothetical protein